MTNYPTNLDTLTNPTAGDSVSVVSHASQHTDANDAIEALQAKVGKNTSEVTTSHDYKLSNVTGSAKAVASDTYATDKAGLEASINANTSSITTKVGNTGNETIAGVKTFSSSPIVPDPSNSTDATNKQWVEDYVEVLGKESVGLLTQGEFIDKLTTNLRFSKEQDATLTSLSGGIGNFLDTLDGVTYISSRGTGGDVYMYDMTLSGGTFTINQILTVSGVNGDATAIKYLSPTEAVIVFNEGSSTININIAYLKKTAGTWAVVNTVSYVSGAISNHIYDIYVVSSAEFYIAVRNDANNLAIRRYLIAGGNVVIDSTFSTVTINKTDMYGAVFNSATEIFVQCGSSTEKYSFSSGTSAQIGTTLAFTASGAYYMKLYSNNHVMLSNGDRISTYFFDGTNFNLVSKTLDAVTITGIINWYVQYPTNTFVSPISKIVLSGTGYENSIEDLNANGHIGHMISQNESFAQGQTFSIIGSSGNDGSYTNTIGNSLNKVMLTTAPAVIGDMVCTIQPNLSTRNGYAWLLKGSNYYLGTN